MRRARSKSGGCCRAAIADDHPLEGHPDKVAIHAVCRENVFWETLESLKRAGASALLVLPVEKMLS